MGACRTRGVALVLLLLSPSLARTDDHWADYQAGGAASNGSVVGNVRFSGNMTIRCRHSAEDLGDCWNISADYNTATLPWTSSERRTTLTAGARYDFPRIGGVLWFIHALAGKAHRENWIGASDWSGRAVIVGGGIDWTVPVDTHPDYKLVKRITVDVVMPAWGKGTDPDPYVRLSVGLVMRCKNLLCVK